MAQFVGGIGGVALAATALRSQLADPHVNWVTTSPGASGIATAFIAELVISFILMLTVLTVSNTRRLNRFTALFAGALVATYIAVEAPLSGMSMNPARTFGSALAGSHWNALWLYFTAPPLGMGVAAAAYLRVRGAHGVLCAKLHHHNDKRCIFRCQFGDA